MAQITVPVQAQHVSPAMFQSLLTSRRRMVRDDRAQAGLRGLRDIDTGEQFFVRASELHVAPSLLGGNLSSAGHAGGIRQYHV